MFGEMIDYRILKPMTHSSNRATEEELNERAKSSTFTLDDAGAYVNRFRTEYFENRFPIDPKLSYLDIGCGMGRLSIGLSLAGAKDITGIDIVARHIDEAKALSERLIPDHQILFQHSDIHTWQQERRYDVIITLGAMEHIHDPAKFLHQMRNLLKPKGQAFVSFEPFHSPIGDHMRGFFNFQIPWRGCLFSEKAILRLRRECFRPTDPAKRYQDIVGGLNLMTFTQYVQWAHDAGLEFVYHAFNPQLKHHKRYRPLYPLSWVLTRIPKIRDYFGIFVFSILKRRN
jgi:SAM-dependent methyltransferase